MLGMIQRAFVACAIVAAACVLFPLNTVGAARSVHVVMKNDSDRALIFVRGDAKHGIVTHNPPSRINPGDFGELFAESSGVATGTEGSVTYRIDGASGDVRFGWDNPFVGDNSAGGSAPSGFSVVMTGDKGNRTLVFFSFHRTDSPVARCNANWVIDHLGHHAEDKLDASDVGPGFLTTPLKRLGFGGWVDTGCRATADGWVVRNAQWSTDKFWTIDVKVHSFVIGDRQLKSELAGQRFLRIEVEPGTPAHRAANARTDQFIRVEGIILIDTHHGDELIEVHPFDPIVAARDPADFGPDTCKQGFVWREAFANDHVCVLPSERDEAKRDNAEAGARRQPGGGGSGPDTCKAGFVWREARPSDHVCVIPSKRAQVADDNRRASERRR